MRVKLIVVQLINNFCIFAVTRKFNAVFHKPNVGSCPKLIFIYSTLTHTNNIFSAYVQNKVGLNL